MESSARARSGTRRGGVLLAVLLLLGALGAAPAVAGTTAGDTTAGGTTAGGTTAGATTVGDDTAPEEFVALTDVAPTIVEEIRYAGHHNFVGRPNPGYDEDVCLLTRPLADALTTAQERLARQGYTLKVYDCYRPQRTVDSFVSWSKDLDDQAMKEEFYPRENKAELFERGYIAEQSGHSRGSTVDLTLVRLPPAPQRPYVPGEPLHACYAPVDVRFPDNQVDMGTGYDCFDTISHTDDPRVTGEPRRNRDLLRTTLESVGLENYENEWWHFTLTGEPFPDTYFDFPVSRDSLSS